MIKSTFDFIVALIVFVFLTPVFICVAAAVFCFVGRPIFFAQPRPGKREVVFTMYKFRTMTNQMDENGMLLPDEQRLNFFGKFLRSTSLDELPGLLNVLKGEMSLVGPRPLLVEYLDLYNSEQKKRHLVKPGITGWAQVNGRNSVTWEDKFEMDVWYVKNQSFLLDIKILLKTVQKVLLREGVSSKEEVTMSKFKGNEAKKVGK